MICRVSFVAALLAASACRLSATQIYTWTGTTSGDTNVATNWSPSQPVTGTANNSLTFGSSTFGTAALTNITLSASFETSGITFTSAAPNYVFGASNGAALGIGSSGITLSSTAGNNIVSSSSLPLQLLANQTWNTGNASGNLSVAGNVSGAFALTIAGGGGVTLSGTNTYSGGTTVNNATNLLFMNSAALPATGNVTVTGGSYVGVGAVGMFGTLLGKIANKNSSSAFNGSVGFDTATTATNPTTFSDAIDLSLFNGNSNFDGIGSSSRAILSGTITTASGQDYKFGGGDGVLYITSGLAASGSAGINVSSSTTASREDEHLTVYLQGTDAFTGNVSVTASSLIFDSTNALASGSTPKFTLGDDGYVGYTENSTFGSFAAFLTKVKAASFSFSNDSILGIDSHNTASPRPSVSDTIDLHLLTPIFLGTATNVTLTGTITAPSGGALFLTGVAGGYLRIDSALTAANVSSGVTVGFTESEATDTTFHGYVDLRGASTYSGNTSLQSGYLLVGASSTPVSGTITSGPLGTGTLLVPSGADKPALAASVDGVSIANNLSLAAGLQIGIPATTTATDLAFPLQSLRGNSLTLTGVISGTGAAIDYEGSGTLTLTGANTYTGGTTINAGTLQIGNGGASGSITGNVTDNGSLAFDVSNPLTLTGVISGNGTVTQLGTGALTLSGANTYTGLTSIKAGGLLVSTVANGGSASPLGASANAAANLVIDGGFLRYTGTGGSTDRLFTVGANGSALDAQGSGAINFTNTGAIGFTGTNTAHTFTLTGTSTASNTLTPILADQGTGITSLAKTGAGTWVLAGANTYTGATTIGGGTLKLGVANALSNATDVNLSLGGATLDLNGFADTVGSIAGVSNTTIVTTGGLATADNSSTTFSGNLTGVGSFSKGGTGTLTLSGVNTYSGATVIFGGTLQLGIGGALASSTDVSLPNSGATLDVHGATTTVGSVAGVSGTTISLGTGALTTADNSSTAFAGAITGGGSFTKGGTGTLTLSGANTYTGATVISGGTLQLGAGGTLASSSDVSLPNSGATFDVNGATTTVNSIAGVSGSTISLGSGSLTSAGTGSTAFAGTLTGTGTLTKNGTGTLTLSGANTYSGATTIGGGTLVIANDSNLGTAPSSAPPSNQFQLVFNGGTLETTASFALNTFRNINLSGTGGTFNTDASTNLTFAGPITGGNLTKTGTGTLTLSGSTSYGATFINAGTLALGSTGSLNTGGDVAVSSGATFSVGNNQTTRALSGSGNVSIGDGQKLTVNLPSTGTGSTSTFSGSLSGNSTANFGEAGAGTLTLSGSSPSFAGPIAVNSGTLMVSSAGALGATTAGTTVASPGTLILNNVAVGAEPVTLTGTGASNGGALLGIGTASLSGPITLAANSTIGVPNTSSDVLTLSGAIGESGGPHTLTKTGVGTLALTGQSTYTGNTSVSQGTLLIGTANALPTSTSLAMSGTLDIAANQTVAGFNSSASNSVIKIENGATFNIALGNALFGTVTISQITDGTTPGGALEIGSNNGNGHTVGFLNDNTYTGGTTIDAGGALLLGNNNTTGSIQGNVTDNGVLIFNRGNTMTFGGVISGSGSVQEGVLSGTTTGDVKLTGNNTYTGGTMVNSKALIIGDGGTNGSIVGNVVVSGNASIGFNRSDAVSFAGVVSGAGSLVKASTGTLTLTGQSTYTGTTTINGGTLLVGTTNALPTATQVSLALGSTLEVANNQTIAGFFGNSTGSTLMLDVNKTLTVAMPSANTFTTFAGNVNGTGTFTASGQGGDFVNLTGTVAAPIVQGTGATIVTPSTPISLTGLTGPLSFSGNATQTLGNVISGSGSILVSAGSTTFTAGNSYTGATAITGGKLIVDNSSGSSATGTGTVTVSGGGILGGSGFISGPLVLSSGGTVAPGNSPGMLTVGPSTFAGGATFSFDINNATGTAGTNWDLLSISGGLTIGATTGSPFVISLNSLDGSNNSGLAQNFSTLQSYSWEFVTTTTGIANFSPAAFSFNTSQFQNGVGAGLFSVSQSGNNLFLNFAPVPEPSTWALLVSGLGMFGFLALRRRRKL